MAKRKRRARKTNSKARLFVPLVAGTLILWSVVELILLPRGDEFRIDPPKRTSLMEQRIEESRLKRENYTIHYRWIPLSSISQNLIEAVLVAEDASFFSHRGFDYGEMYHAISNAITKLKIPRGASTITQQVAKNLYLSTSRSPLRKIREAVLTRRLEGRLTKRRILELYLNIIEWGEGIYGADAASRHYLGRAAAQLSKQDAAFLAALIPNPFTVYNPKRAPERVNSRKKLILKLMEQSKVLESSRQFLQAH